MSTGQSAPRRRPGPAWTARRCAEPYLARPASSLGVLRADLLDGLHGRRLARAVDRDVRHRRRLRRAVPVLLVRRDDDDVARLDDVLLGLGGDDALALDDHEPLLEGVSVPDGAAARAEPHQSQEELLCRRLVREAGAGHLPGEHGRCDAGREACVFPSRDVHFVSSCSTALATLASIADPALRCDAVDAPAPPWLTSSGRTEEVAPCRCTSTTVRPVALSSRCCGP